MRIKTDFPHPIRLIDLQTDVAGAYAIEHALADKSCRKVEYSAAERIRSHFGALAIDGVTVEIMGDIQKQVHGEIRIKPAITR